MTEELYPMHYVCTLEEAKKLIDEQSNFLVGNCGCRESRGGCSKSRMDICLHFLPVTPSGSGGFKEITKQEVGNILREAEEKHLVARPFRSLKDKNIVEGICFCCSCCCGYFLNREEICGKGKFIEITDMTSCTHCGACTEICYFNARKMESGELKINSEECYGCGLCVNVCPIGCIDMKSHC